MRLRERMASNENYQISSELSDPLTARKHFTSELFKEKKIGKLEKRLVSRDEVKNLIQLLDKPAPGIENKQQRRRYYYFKKIFEINEQGKLIDKKEKKEVVCIEDMFDVCMEIHKAVNGRGRVLMLQKANESYANMTRPIVERFLKFNQEYQFKRKIKQTFETETFTVESTFAMNNKMQIDKIDMSDLPDENYKRILKCLDYSTEFVILKPLNDAPGKDEVENFLIEIFSLFGVPSIICCDHSQEDREKLVTNLKSLWPGLNLDHGPILR